MRPEISFAQVLELGLDCLLDRAHTVQVSPF